MVVLLRFRFSEVEVRVIFSICERRGRIVIIGAVIGPVWLRSLAVRLCKLHVGVVVVLLEWGRGSVLIRAVVAGIHVVCIFVGVAFNVVRLVRVGFSLGCDAAEADGCVRSWAGRWSVVGG